MAIHVALVLSLIGSLGLAGVLLVWADRVAGARMLVLFLLGVSVWIVGNELPTWAGPGWDRLGLSLMAVAPLASSAFLHFAVTFCRADRAAWLVRPGYLLGGAMLLLGVLVRPGEYEPFAGLRWVAMPNWVGWTSSVAWGVLALAGQVVLARAWLGARGLPRRQIEAVCASSAFGLACMAGYGAAALRLDVYPWPLLGLPLYPLILVYGILRYRVLVANAWARRAVAWSLLAALAVGIVALVPLLPPLADGPAERWVSGALVAVACLALAGPARRLAERVVYPGGALSARDVQAWRAALSRAETVPDLAQAASALLTRRLGLPVAVVVGDAAAPDTPAVPVLRCHEAEGAWRIGLQGWEAAPPGPRHLAELFGEVLAEEAGRLQRAQALAVRERERQLQARLAELGQLAATVAHDVRNPLNIIGMAAAGAPAEVRAEIREQVDRIARLSRDLLDYARPWGIEPAACDLAERIRNAARHRPGTEIGPGLDDVLMMHADARRLDQALANVLDNACATGARTAVELETRDGMACIHVCDAGPGVPADLRDRLFQPFVSRSPGGTGLGLAIVLRIMEAHGGGARLTERRGWSTCVTLTLPLRGEALQPEVMRAEPLAAGPSQAGSPGAGSPGVGPSQAGPSQAGPSQAGPLHAGPLHAGAPA